ncbi:MAG TPA: right-handed parallel beta-helix repeat-containing protein [bacterium]|nr:right-handed parallel beta-helix repeat-containing protein [bacterium]HPQ65211.1 right-handed parallel beta-helix repeat-containing protein [bacterium]
MRWLATVSAALLISIPASAAAADFDGDSRDDVAVFRPSSGLWAVRGYTKIYFGASADEPSPGDYTGDGIADFAVFRASANLWAVRGFTRIYFGQAGDSPLRGAGGGQKLYDYVVRPGDGNDLVAALESDVYASVFVPAGTYSVGQNIDVDNVRRVSAEADFTSIDFSGSYKLEINSPNCTVEGLRVRYGAPAGEGNFSVNAAYVTVRDCRSVESTGHGFRYSASADSVVFSGCVARNAAGSGFYGDASVGTSSLTGCKARDCGSAGFRGCCNLASCAAIACAVSGFYDCWRMSACYVDGESTGDYGVQGCYYVSSTLVTGCTFAWDGGSKIDPDSCNNP